MYGATLPKFKKRWTRPKQIDGIKKSQDQLTSDSQQQTSPRRSRIGPGTPAGWPIQIGQSTSAKIPAQRRPMQCIAMDAAQNRLSKMSDQLNVWKKADKENRQAQQDRRPPKKP